MKYYGCDRCFTVIKVVDRPDEIHRLITAHPMWKGAKEYPCIRSGCEGPMQELNEAEVACMRSAPEAVRDHLIRFHELTAQELFRALCGFGMPDELGAEPEVVRALLLSAKICDLSIKRSRSGRTVLDRIDLDNGISLHLASAPAGPTVFKVTRRDDETEDDHRGVLPDPEGCGVPREDERGRSGAGGEGDPTGGASPVDGGQRHDGDDHRGASPHAEELPRREGDDDPGTGRTPDAREETPGLRAGPGDGGHHPERPGGGTEAVRPDR